MVLSEEGLRFLTDTEHLMSGNAAERWGVRAGKELA